MVFPGIAIVVAVLAFNQFGDGLRDALDPPAARHQPLGHGLGPRIDRGGVETATILPSAMSRYRYSCLASMMTNSIRPGAVPRLIHA